MSRPSVSVIIPAWNAAGYLPAAIASVEAQRIDDLEVLVLDDGSTDATAEWLAEAALSRPWLRLFKGGGMGPARARNYLINHALSDLVAFLDADDVWHEGKLAAEIAFHRAHPRVAFTFTDYEHVDPDGRSLGTAFGYWKPALAKTAGEGFGMVDLPLETLFGCNLAGTSTVVAKREFLQNANGFAEDLPSAEDWDLWLRLAACGQVAASNCVRMTYLVRPDSETANRDKRIAAMEMILSRHDRDGVAPAVRRMARSKLSTVRAEQAAIAGRKPAALAWRLHALMRQPTRRNGFEALAAAARLGGLVTGRAV